MKYFIRLPRTHKRCCENVARYVVDGAAGNYSIIVVITTVSSTGPGKLLRKYARACNRRWSEKNAVGYHCHAVVYNNTRAFQQGQRCVRDERETI
jgi:hypothetical protein